ncbi:MAG: hypothetical protein RLZZ450_5853 [Pseudomonadota bacterium]|jgi:PAS domain S-box-containing protein
MTELRQTDRSRDDARVDAASGGTRCASGPVDSTKVLDAVDDGVLVVDATTGHIAEANAGASRLLAQSRATLLSLSFFSLAGTHEEGAPHAVRACAAVAMTTGEARFEARYLRGKGGPLWCEVRLRRADAVCPGHLVVLIRDIEAVKEKREQARVIEERYRGLVKNLPRCAIMLCDHDLRLVLADGPEIGTGGMSKQELEGRTIYEALPADFVALVEDPMHRMMAGESFTVDIPYGPRWYTHHFLPIFDDAGERVLYGMVLVVNITDRRLAEEALRKSEERFVRIFQSSADAIIVTQVATGKIVEVNQAFTRVIGWERDEALDKSTIELGLWPDPSERPRLLRELYSEGAPAYLDRPVVRRDGVVLEGTVSLRPIELDGVACRLFTFRDNTEHKRVERERELLIAELTARNAEMEQFTFTVSHDLKSPLVTITGFLGMLERDLAADNKEGVRSDIARIGSAANKMLGLLSDLLELSRVGRTNHAMENVPMSEVMGDALELLSGALAARNVEVEVADDLPEVYGDRVRLLQVAQNLIENAVKYMGDQPSPRIEIGTRYDPKYEVCFVKDNGVGVDCRYVERIFGLFEKLNPRSEGSGVGLALVRRILESHGGSIWVESGDEGGSTFVFRIPRQHPPTPSSLRPGGLV